MVGKFDNRTGFMRGIFVDGPDRLSSQAKSVLIGHLQRTGRFSVLDRDNMAEISRESKISGKKQTLKGADYTVTGDIAEFGRKETGDRQLFGVLGSGKKQSAYSKVTLNVVDVATSEVVYSASGAGEYALSNREVIGFARILFALPTSFLTEFKISLKDRLFIQKLITSLIVVNNSIGHNRVEASTTTN